MTRRSIGSIPTVDTPPERWLWVIWALATLCCGYFETLRLLAASRSDAGIFAWFTNWDSETTLPLLALCLFPFAVFVSPNRKAVQRSASQPEDSTGSDDSPTHQPAYQATGRQMVISVLLLMAVSLGGSSSIGYRSISVGPGNSAQTTHFADLPPAYHDEYSYLLQAETFMDGRLSYPPMTIRPDLFHQMHVLNEHRTASRYFPWTGLWMAPFVALGIPVWGHYIAGALSACFFYLSLVQRLPQRISLASGFLIAASPGLAVFSNLLLAHHPTMLALSIFLWAFLRMLYSGCLCFAAVSGTALTLAMLGRPMTAAGFALPFGIVFVWKVIRSKATATTATLTWKHLLGMAIPLLLGFAVLAIQNQSVTGSWTRSAYQEYTDKYTPRHRYGFNNAVTETNDLVPEALQAYDRWATNLTPQVALQNVKNRLLASLQWSLAIFPILFGLLIALPRMWRSLLFRQSSAPASDTTRSQSQLLLLFAASILTLHLAHVPYWFDGIMHWHYVFETAPLILMLVGVGFCDAFAGLQHRMSRSAAAVCVLAVAIAGLTPGWFSSTELWGPSKVAAAVSEQAFSRKRIGYFRQMTESPAISKPALILVDERGTDPQLSYIINPPTQDASVLVCRRPDSDREMDELAAAFPDRKLYIFDPDSFQFTTASNR
jgi:hypothetical protein